MMFLKYLKDCREFVAGDDSILRELLHPEKTGLQIHYSLAHAEVRVGQMTKPLIDSVKAPFKIAYWILIILIQYISIPLV